MLQPNTQKQLSNLSNVGTPNPLTILLNGKNFLTGLEVKCPSILEQTKRNSQKCEFFSFIDFTPIFIFSKFEHKLKNYEINTY